MRQVEERKSPNEREPSPGTSSSEETPRKKLPIGTLLSWYLHPQHKHISRRQQVQEPTALAPNTWRASYTLVLVFSIRKDDHNIETRGSVSSQARHDLQIELKLWKFPPRARN